MSKPQITIVGGGMITQVQILPSLYHLQREGVVGDIRISALNAAPLKTLAEDPTLKRAFPGQSFTPFPDYTKVDLAKPYPDLFKEVLSGMKPRNVVVVAVPDQLHYGTIKAALNHDQHVLTVKPLVLKHDQAMEIEKLAFEKGLVVGVEYHKRFDDRNLMARRRYRAGEFGEFKAGQANLVEKWYYRFSNFQNWCTVENSDPFSYIACHYIDLVAFITGLRPKSVSVHGLVEKWPNGRAGFLWSDGRVVWENNASLSVLNGFGYPDLGPGGNSQGMLLFTTGGDAGALISHSDQDRGVKHCVLKKGRDPGDTEFMEPNPDYFQLIPLGGEGLVPVGYGYRSIAYIARAIVQVERASAGLDAAAGLKARQKLLEEYDREGIMATPKNSAYNELVMEAGRLSILNGGREAVIEYGERPHARFKEASEYAALK